MIVLLGYIGAESEVNDLCPYTWPIESIREWVDQRKGCFYTRLEAVDSDTGAILYETDGEAVIPRSTEAGSGGCLYAALSEK